MLTNARALSWRISIPKLFLKRKRKAGSKLKLKKVVDYQVNLHPPPVSNYYKPPTSPKPQGYF